MIIAEMVLTLSWMKLFGNRLSMYAWAIPILFETVRECMHKPRRPIKVWDYSWGDAYIVIDNAILNRLQPYTWSTPRQAKYMIIAEAVPIFAWTMLLAIVCKNTHDAPWHIENYYYYSCEGACIAMDGAIWNRLQLRSTHSRTLKIYDHGWEGAYIVMDDAIRNRLQM